MSLPIVFRDTAQAELDEATVWYEQQRAGLGTAFAIAVERVLTKAANQPDFYPPIFDGTREGIVQRFPYCVYYREEPGHILVLAIIHNSRDPAVWQRRT